MKHKLNIKDEEIDSIRQAIGQAIAKGVTEPALVRLDYKLEKLRLSPPRAKKIQEKSKEVNKEQKKDIKSTKLDLGKLLEELKTKNKNKNVI